MSLYNNGFPIGYDARQLNNPRPSQFTQNMPQEVNQPVSYITWVEGENAARAYMLRPNTILPLWDSETNTIYIKSTDQFGKPNPTKILRYTVEEMDSEPAQPSFPQPAKDQYVTKQDLDVFLSEVKGLINAQSNLPRTANAATAANTSSEPTTSSIRHIPEKSNAVSGK